MKIRPPEFKRSDYEVERSRPGDPDGPDPLADGPAPLLGPKEVRAAAKTQRSKSSGASGERDLIR